MSASLFSHSPYRGGRAGAGNEGICEAEQRMRRVRKRLRKKECKRGRKKRKGKDRKKLRTTLQLGNVSFYNSLCVVIIISMKMVIKS